MAHTLNWVVAVLIVLMAGMAGDSAAWAVEGPNWCAHAQRHLRKSGQPANCAEVPRCVRLNNYGCTQNHSSTPFPGQVTTPDGRPVVDEQKHVVYEHPKWSLARSVGTLLRYQNDGKRTARLMAETYAPWCDTRGSKRTRNGWGRTCVDRLPSVPADYRPRCERPAGEEASNQQCANCNCPNRTARFWIRGTARSIDERIDLFDAFGQPLPAMSRFLKQVSTIETGYVPSDQLVAEGIAVFRP